MPERAQPAQHSWRHCGSAAIARRIPATASPSAARHGLAKSIRRQSQTRQRQQLCPIDSFVPPPESQCRQRRELDSIAAISWQLRHDRGRTSRAQLTIWTTISAWLNMPFSTGAVLCFDRVIAIRKVQGTARSCTRAGAYMKRGQIGLFAVAIPGSSCSYGIAAARADTPPSHCTAVQRRSDSA